ncbi:M15 family metallopeptidase [Microbacterium sp. WCS2018Hpa-9]|uniref:M15 family metallopeptidase n=1 Tax=Microbacterium sp. WCS2018Hpa-9 TaxID=3073635 RepID=UPI00288B779C|nr:M15 family metallopeptidase [Microbacterium sp. WCS2018Hpa-9]
MGGIEYVYWDGARLTPWMKHCLERLDADLRRLFGVHLTLDSSKGIRLNSEQRAIFLDRYRPQSSGSGPFGDVRWWNGVRYVRRSGLGTVAQPGTSNHEIQGSTAAVDLADSGGSGIGTMGSARSNWLRRNAGNYGLVPEGFNFNEAWHYAVPNIFNPVPAGGLSKPEAPPLSAKASTKMTIYARRDDGLVVAIPEGGPTYNYQSAAEYNRHRETVAAVNGQRQKDGQPLVTLPPVLGSIVTMTSERLNDLIRSQGAVLSPAPVVKVEIPDVDVPELNLDEIAKKVNDEADKRARDRLKG